MGGTETQLTARGLLTRGKTKTPAIAHSSQQSPKYRPKSHFIGTGGKPSPTYTPSLGADSAWGANVNRLVSPAPTPTNERSGDPRCMRSDDPCCVRCDNPSCDTGPTSRHRAGSGRPASEAMAGMAPNITPVTKINEKSRHNSAKFNWAPAWPPVTPLVGGGNTRTHAENPAKFLGAYTINRYLRLKYFNY